MPRMPRRAVLAAVLALGALPVAARAGDDYVGTWKVTDSHGRPFEITLNADGTARSTLHPEHAGTWTRQDGAAVIVWNTGWTSKIQHLASGRAVHMGYAPGQKPTGTPHGTSAAEKLR